jgi:hypothetical protein
VGQKQQCDSELSSDCVVDDSSPIPALPRGEHSAADSELHCGGDTESPHE